MDNATQTGTPNQLVQATRAAGAADRAGDRAQLIAAAKALVQGGPKVTIQPFSNENLGRLPSPAIQQAKSTGQTDDSPYRAIWLDKPPRSNDRSR